MTLLNPAPTATAVMWRLADTDFHVAHAADRFGGTIDVHGTHHYVRNCFGQYLGDYATLAAAQQRLAAHISTYGA